MIKLKINDNYVYLDGTRGRNNDGKIKKIFSKKNDCKTVRQARVIAAYAGLQAVLLSHRDIILSSVEDANRRDIVLDVPLSGSITTMVTQIEDECSKAGRSF